MMKLTENEIKEIFGDKTFSRGLDYYNYGHVFGPVKIDDTIYAQVMGSMSAPYETRAFTNDSAISTRCTCPVGYMCKHGAALLLKWVNEPSSFTDANRFLDSLKVMTKEEIIDILRRIIEQNPSLINEFSIEAEEKPEVNIDAISNRIGWIVHGELDYYHIWDAIRDLEGIKNTADRLKEKGSYKNAARIYFALVKGGVTAYEEGADDSDGNLGDFVSVCITDFNECMEQIDDPSYRDVFLEKILDVVDSEDYGLKTEEMLYSVINEENIHHVEEYLIDKLKKERRIDSDFHYNYKKHETLDQLIELYEKLGKPEEKLRLAQYELVDKEDYVRLANVLLAEERLEDAFDAVKKGLELPEGTHFRLNELYFDIARMLLHQKPELIDFKTSFDAALEVMSRHFDKKIYEGMKELFYGIGKLDEFKSAMLENLKNRDYAVLALLNDEELMTAVDIICKEPVIHPGIIISVSKTVRDKGMLDESAELTRMVLEMGLADTSSPVKELVKVMVDVSDVNVLQGLCNRILKMKYPGTAILLIPYLLKKAPEMAAALTRKFINDMPLEIVIKVAKEVASEEGIELCRLRINEDILRSHVHYDKAVFLLRTIRDISASEREESGWLEFIKRFAAENKGKKKLIEMIRKEFGMVI